MKIFITDGNNRATLAIVRSLSKLGHTILVGEKTQPSLASSSKYTAGFTTYPDPITLPEDFIEYMCDYLDTHNIDIIIPVADITTILIAKNLHNLPDSCKFPFGDTASILHAADKSYITKIADEIGVPTPKTAYVTNPTNFNIDLFDISYPVVLKPSKSRVWTGEDWLFTSVSYANTKEELTQQLNDKHPLEFPVLLQERIVGPGVGVFMCINNGKLVAQFSHQRLREKPPSGGVSVLRESIPVHSEAAEHALKLLQKINWQGVAMVEFKMDASTNTPILMEINGRFWGSLQLAIDSGVNFPALLVASTLNEKITPVLEYKKGIKLRWLWGDIDNLLMILFKSHKSLKLPEAHPGRFFSILRFFKLWSRTLRYEILCPSDLKPWLFETKQRFFKRKH